MRHYKVAKVFFCLAALLFIAKPYIGFAFLNRNNPPATTNILVKIFSKRKTENTEQASSNIISAQKKLRDDPNLFSLRFCFFLALFFITAFFVSIRNINRYLRTLLYGLAAQPPAYLHNRALLI